MINVNTITLDKIGKVKMCKRVLKEQTSEKEEVPFYKISTFGGKADTFISRKLFEEYKAKYSYPKIGDILISAAGTIGKTVIFDGQESFFQDSNIVWIDNNEQIITNSFLYYFYQTNPWQTTNGSTIKRIYNEDLRSIKITYPTSILVQKKIAKVLSDLDAKIELNNKINAELEAMAKTLYDYWFVQFDFPFVTSSGVEKPYKSSGGKMIYNEELKREIPEGWEVKKIKDIAKTGSGGTPKSTEKAYYENGTIPWINSGELNNAFIISTENFITELGMNNSSAKIFPANTILMAMYGATAGKTSIISFQATTNQAICAIMPLKDEIFHYTKFVLDDMYQYLINLSTGSARDNLSQEKIKELNIVIPSDKIIEQFSETVKQFFYKIENNLKQNHELAQLRDWLLPMLMNGQVTVGEAEEQLGMVAESGENYKK